MTVKHHWLTLMYGFAIVSIVYVRLTSFVGALCGLADRFISIFPILTPELYTVL